MWNPTVWFCNSQEIGWGGLATGKSSNGIEKVYGTCALGVESMTPGKQWNVDSKKEREAKEVWKCGPEV